MWGGGGGGWGGVVLFLWGIYLAHPMLFHVGSFSFMPHVILLGEFLLPHALLCGEFLSCF